MVKAIVLIIISRHSTTGTTGGIFRLLPDLSWSSLGPMRSLGEYVPLFGWAHLRGRLSYL